jgi:hypothetical protein
LRYWRGSGSAFRRPHGFMRSHFADVTETRETPIKLLLALRAIRDA